MEWNSEEQEEETRDLRRTPGGGGRGSAAARVRCRMLACQLNCNLIHARACLIAINSLSSNPISQSEISISDLALATSTFGDLAP
jgi:hypothetical protein